MDVVLIGQGLALLLVVAALAFGWIKVQRWLTDLQHLTESIASLRRRLEADHDPLSASATDSKFNLNHHVQSLKILADRFADRVQSQSEIEALRRKLIANLTHDLRSPLTVVQGYLETMQIKGNALSAEQREHYLAIAIKHCFRLNKMAAEVFDLSQLESKEAHPNTTHFSLSELSQHVLRKFELVALEREIFLGLVGDTVRHMVVADVSMIERVLDNLIDNALRFTPPGGEVTLTLQQVDTQVMVKVVDTGSGIPAQEIPMLFHRFHQVPGHHPQSDQAPGVGLLIVKRILDLHGSEIQVESELGMGLSIQFSLLLARRHSEQ